MMPPTASIDSMNVVGFFKSVRVRGFASALVNQSGTLRCFARVRERTSSHHSKKIGTDWADATT